MCKQFVIVNSFLQGITADTTIEDIAGQTMPALTVFEHTIRYLKNHCLESLENMVTYFNETDIQYVLTVPAIWDDKAKCFMRRAAIQVRLSVFTDFYRYFFLSPAFLVTGDDTLGLSVCLSVCYISFPFNKYRKY